MLIVQSAALQRYSAKSAITALQRQVSVTALQRQVTGSALQRYSATAPQRYSATAPSSVMDFQLEEVGTLIQLRKKTNNHCVSDTPNV